MRVTSRASIEKGAAVLLSELVAVPRLGLRVVHAGHHDPDRAVGRVITIDLLDPGRFLGGGELVLTGLVWRRTPADSATFVSALARSGAVTLLAGKALLGTIPDDLVEACREYDVTLVEVPADVPFADIAEQVAAADTAESGARMSASLVRQRELLSAMADGRTLDDLTARVSEEIGRVCRVLTPGGRHVVEGPGALDAETVDVTTRAFLSVDRLPAVVTGPDAALTLFPTGSGLVNRLTAQFVVVEGDHREWPRDHVDAVHELAAITALDRSRHEERLRALRPLAAETLGLVESGASHTDVAARLRQAGVDPDRPVAAVALGVEDDPDDIAVTLLEDVALLSGPPLVARTRDGLLVALLPASHDLADRVRTAFTRLAPGLGRSRLSAGVSGQTPSSALTGALEEARFAQQVAASARTPVSVVGSDQVTSHVLLLATVPDDVRRTFAHRVLGGVLDHDGRTQADLVDTLRVFLECSGSWARAAEALHMHVNTVRYRIEKIEELTGRDLSRLTDRVDIFLALESL